MVGLSNTALGWFVYSGCIFIGLHYLLANFIGFVISVANAYYWSVRFVFVPSSSGYRKLWRTLLKTYATYSFTGIFLNSAILCLCVEYLGWGKYVSFFICLSISVPLNFILNKYWSFKDY